MRKQFNEARRRASESPYHGCATAVFAAVVDTLGLRYGDEAFRAMIGFAGGVGHLVRGTCGALSGAAAAISLSYNKSREEVISALQDPHPVDQHLPEFFQEIFEKIAYVAGKMHEKYGSTLCCEIQFELYGKVLDFLDPAKHWQFSQYHKSYPINCYTVEGDVANWTVEAIIANKSRKAVEHMPNSDRLGNKQS